MINDDVNIEETRDSIQKLFGGSYNNDQISTIMSNFIKKAQLKFKEFFSYHFD